MFAISYRLATKGETFPQAVQDVLAGVQFVRGKAGEFGIDPQRIGLLGASAGGHLASLAALSGKKFTGGYPQDPFAGVSTEVKALVGVYGVYDMVAMWTTYQIQGGVDNNIQKFLGASPMENRHFILTPRRPATPPSPTTRSACSWSPAPTRIWLTPSSTPSRSRWRSSRPASSCGPASCRARRIIG